MSIRSKVAALDAVVSELDGETRARALEFLRGALAFAAGGGDLIPEPVAAAVMDVIIAAGADFAFRGGEHMRAKLMEAIGAAPALVESARAMLVAPDGARVLPARALAPVPEK